MELPTMWQDWVLAIGQFIFAVALLPSVFSINKPHWASSLLTSSVLSVFSYTFWTLGLLWSTAMSALVAATWFVLLLQSLATSIQEQ